MNINGQCVEAGVSCIFLNSCAHKQPLPFFVSVHLGT